MYDTEREAPLVLSNLSIIEDVQLIPMLVLTLDDSFVDRSPVYRISPVPPLAAWNRLLLLLIGSTKGIYRLMRLDLGTRLLCDRSLALALDLGIQALDRSCSTTTHSLIHTHQRPQNPYAITVVMFPPISVTDP